ncbi:unnamed protein product [Paramecium octaurelia]|uniref:Uncharacterized protein n=1 Tax=Paramecium octaurelia TaxID=43137 RepID=A0A8S1TTI5_PAROT|nr:unnamed protein product [Paramecium octaurelia]
MSVQPNNSVQIHDDLAQELLFLLDVQKFSIIIF